MYTSYYIVGTFIVLSIFYFIFIIPKMKKKYENQANDIRDNLKGNEASEKERLLKDPEALKLISDKTAGENLIGIANCMEKRDLGNVLKDGALNFGGKVLGKATGIGIKTQDNVDVYYVALTDQNLHYFVYDEGTCLEHLVFDKSKIKRMEIEKSTLAANYTGGSSGTDKFTIDYDGKKHGFYLYENFVRLPSDSGIGMDTSKSNDKIIATELFTKPFYAAVK